MGCGSSVDAVNTTTPPRSGEPQALVPSEAGLSSGISPRVKNRPLITPSSYSYGKAITNNELVNLRTEFWTTRVYGGDSNLWQSLQGACDAILTNDLVLANAIMEACNLSSPTGSLASCYDTRGYEYVLPPFCFSVPVELASGIVGGGKSGTTTTPTAVDTATVPAGANGKPKGPPISLRLRINPGDFTITITTCGTGDSIGTMKARIEVLTGTKEMPTGCPVCPVDRQRIMFLGRELKNSDVIGALGLDCERVVQVFLRPAKR